MLYGDTEVTVGDLDPAQIHKHAVLKPFFACVHCDRESLF